MIRLLMIADDFTGALDTGVQLASCGAATRVITDRTADLGAAAQAADVLVVDAETRHLPAAEAYEVVANIVKQAVRLGVPAIYKKTDSALRGNVGAELTALMDAAGEKSLAFLPAFPQIGRRTVNGIHYIKEQPVAESVFGIDPFEPVRHSAVAELIAEQSAVPVTLSAPLSETDAAPAAEGITVFDAETLEQLESTGKALAKQNRLHLLAGCAGFGAVLPALLGLKSDVPPARPVLDPRLFVVCGSVNPITVRQMEVAEKNGFARMRLTPQQKMDEGHWETPAGEAEFRALEKGMEEHPFCIIDSNDAGGNQITADYAAARGQGIDDIRVGVAHSIGYVVNRLFTNPKLGTLLVTGGDTLFECMEYMGVHEMEPICELEFGIVLSRFTHKGCTRHVLTKSGGFGGEDLFLALKDKITRS